MREMAEMLVHSTLKRGHSNWLETSHNVFIHFRPKHINLERLHYVVSTELALLQSNMTYLNEKRGPQYHWVIELFRLLKLPVFDGVHAALEAFNERRKAELDRKKTDRCKRRRIELKVERTRDSQHRKKWSKKHGHDTYGSGDSDEEGIELKQKGHMKKQASSGGSVGHVGPPLTYGPTTKIVLLTRGCGKLMFPPTWRMRGHPRTVMSFITQRRTCQMVFLQSAVLLVQ